MATNPDKCEGICLCGRIQIQVTGSPVTSGYCHCKPAGEAFNLFQT